MTCSDECAVEKAEAKEFAYFSGLEAGRKKELERILTICDHNSDTVAVNWLIHLLKKDAK